MKAVVVVDIPDYINDISKVELVYGLYFRKHIEGEPIDPTDILEYREVYPLKPLPKKNQRDAEEDYDYGYKDGWNDCLNKITREVDYEN